MSVKIFHFTGEVHRYEDGKLVESLKHSPFLSSVSPGLVLYEEYEKMRQERDQLARWFDKHAWHHHSCSQKPCTCGYSDVEKSLLSLTPVDDIVCLGCGRPK